jgi:hypothetical protein
VINDTLRRPEGQLFTSSREYPIQVAHCVGYVRSTLIGGELFDPAGELLPGGRPLFAGELRTFANNEADDSFEVA